RACVPFIASLHHVEAPELLNLSVRADSQDACIVSSNIEDITGRHTTSEGKLCSCDRPPRAVASATGQRAPVNDRESAPMTIRCKRSDRVIGEFVTASPIGDNEQPITPRGYKHC